MRATFRWALLAGGLLSLTGCFNRVDTSAVAQEIESEIESQSRRLSLAEVRCPQAVPRQAGAYFRCVGYLRPEGEFTINVVQQDAAGSIEWDIPSSAVILNMAKIEETLQQDFAQAFAKRPTVDCGDLYRLNQPGEAFECEVVGGVVIGADQVTALVVKVAPEGDLNWYELREAIAPVTTAANPATAAATTPNAEPSAASSAPAPAASGAAQTGEKPKVAGTREVERPRVAGDDD